MLLGLWALAFVVGICQQSERVIEAAFDELDDE